MITDQNQAIVWQADYEPFGQVNITTALIENNLRLPGQIYDEETGLLYNFYRDYDPNIGRYIQSDPIGIRRGNNTYNYVLNNPIRLIDPLGLATFDESFSKQGLQRDLEHALEDSKRKLRDCPDCKEGSFPSKGYVDLLISALDRAHFKLIPSVTGLYGRPACAANPPVEGATPYRSSNEIVLDPSSFSSPNECCPIDALLAHEAVHMIGIGNWTDDHRDTAKIELKCFGCSARQ